MKSVEAQSELLKLYKNKSISCKRLYNKSNRITVNDLSGGNFLSGYRISIVPELSLTIPDRQRRWWWNRSPAANEHAYLRQLTIFDSVAAKLIEFWRRRKPLDIENRASLSSGLIQGSSECLRWKSQRDSRWTRGTTRGSCMKAPSFRGRPELSSPPLRMSWLRNLICNSLIGDLKLSRKSTTVT